jgi:hypothetical protein
MKDDPEYIDNWSSSSKMNLLCEDSKKVGLQGSMYFAGLCATIIPVPILSDRSWGRKSLVIFGNTLLITC